MRKILKITPFVPQNAAARRCETANVQFEDLMKTVAGGWNEGNARKAADCFCEDAVYAEPPEKQLHHGRAELHEFFGGDTGADLPMKMTWHHLAFNEAE